MGVNVEEAMSTENNEEQMGTHEPRWGGEGRSVVVWLGQDKEMWLVTGRTGFP